MTIELLKFLRLYAVDPDTKLLHFEDINNNNAIVTYSGGIIKGKSKIGGKQKNLLTRAEIGIVYNCKIGRNVNYLNIPIIESMRKYPD